MAILFLPDIDDALLDRLQRRANANGHSLQAEVKHLLGSIVQHPEATLAHQSREAAVQWPSEVSSGFARVDAVETTGLPASQLLIEDRR